MRAGDLRRIAISAILVLGVTSATAWAADEVSVLIAYYSVTGNTEKMAQGVADGAKSTPGTTVVLKRISDVTADDLLSADAVIVGSPVYFGSMSGAVKSFLDSWFNMGLFRDHKMRNKVGAAFAAGGSFSNGKELTMLGIHAAMLTNQMIVTSGGGGLGATATTGPDSPGIDEKELAEATTLGRRVAEVATLMKRGAATLAHNSPESGK